MTGLTGLLMILSALVSALLVWPVQRYALSRQLTDEPGERRLHTVTTARGGGLAIILVITVFIINQMSGQYCLALLFGILAATAIGWLDDHQSLSARLKLLLMIVVTVLALFLVGVPQRITIIGSSIESLWFLYPALMLVLLWWLNLFNFMDGSNGLASSQGLFSLGVLSWLFSGNETNLPLVTLCLCSAAAIIGFLPWNMPKARIFLGDSGSLGLAMLIGLLAMIKLQQQPSSASLLLIMVAVFGVDATATLLKRMVSGKTWYQAHTEHAYQQLVHLGWSHTRVCAAYMLLNLVLVLPALWLMRHYPDYQLLIGLGVLSALSLLWWLVQKTFQGHSYQSESGVPHV